MAQLFKSRQRNSDMLKQSSKSGGFIKVQQMEENPFSQLRSNNQYTYDSTKGQQAGLQIVLGNNDKNKYKGQFEKIIKISQPVETVRSKQGIQVEEIERFIERKQSDIGKQGNITTLSGKAMVHYTDRTQYPHKEYLNKKDDEEKAWSQQVRSKSQSGYRNKLKSNGCNEVTGSSALPQQINGTQLQQNSPNNITKYGKGVKNAYYVRNKSQGPTSYLFDKTDKLIESQMNHSQASAAGGNTGDTTQRDVELLKAQIQIEQYRLKLMKLQKDKEQYTPTVKELEYFFRQTARNLCKNHLRILLLATSQQILIERDKNEKNLAQQRKKNRNPNCNHNNNSVFYQPNYSHVFKNNERNNPRNKQEVLELILAFIDAPVLDIRQKAPKQEDMQSPKVRRNKDANMENPSLRSSSSTPTMKEEKLSSQPVNIHPNKEKIPNYLTIIESYFPELKDIGKGNKKLLSQLLHNDLNKDQMLEVLRDLMQKLSFKDKKCIYCSQQAMQVFKTMEFTKVKNFMKITSLDPITFVLKQMLDPVKQQVINNAQGEKIVQQQKETIERQKKEQIIQKNQVPLNGNQKFQSPSPLKLNQKKVSQKPSIDKTPAWKNPQYKDKEKALELKEKAFYEFINKQRKLNKLPPISACKDSSSRITYKYFIGKGNNSFLVKYCFKQSRWWWQQGKPNKDDWTSLNFIWTQWRNIKILSKIKINPTDKKENDSTMCESLSSRCSEKPSKFELQTPKRDGRKSQLKKATEIANLGEFEKARDNCMQYNHIENNFQISNKKALFYNMRLYYETIGDDIFKYMPITFHVKTGINDPEFKKFENVYEVNDTHSKNIWIVKPGENTNRGCGITVCKDMQAVKEVVNQSINLRNGTKRSYIIQKYIEKPLLFNKRKFDIRCYSLVTCINGNYCGYWYKEGYLRTSSKEFSLKNCTNKLVHLTNDAIQKRADDYGKFENGNKLSFHEFQKYMDFHSPDLKFDFQTQIFPQLKSLATDTIKAVSRKIDPRRRQNTFELFGYDFMLDDNLKPYLIEVNTNPCLELSAPLLQRLIPQMLENVIKIAVDPLYPPVDIPAQKRAMIPDPTDTRFELIYNEDSEEGEKLINLLSPLNDLGIDVVAEEDIEEDAAGEESEDDEEEDDDDDYI